MSSNVAASIFTRKGNNQNLGVVLLNRNWKITNKEELLKKQSSFTEKRPRRTLYVELNSSHPKAKIQARCCP